MKMDKYFAVFGILIIGAFSSGFRQLDEPDYEPDSWGETATLQKLKVPDGFAGSDGYGGDNGGRNPASDPGVKVPPEAAERYGVQEFSIIATERGYFPNRVIVRRNIPVNLYLSTVDSQNLCFVMKSQGFHFHQGVGAKKVERISFKPTELGAVKFHCPVGNIEGTLIVRD